MGVLDATPRSDVISALDDENANDSDPEAVEVVHWRFSPVDRFGLSPF